MTLYKRHGIFYYDFVVKGVRFNRSTGTTKKSIAKRVADQARDKAKGFPMKGAGMTFAEAIQRGDRDRWRHRKDGEQTVSRLNLIASFLGSDTPLEAIQRGQVENIKAWLEQTNRAPATVNRYLAALKTLLAMAWREWGALESVPPIKLDPEKPEQRRALSPEEVERLLAAVERAESLRLFTFLVDTGLRLGEALGLTRDDIKDGCVHLSDTKSGRPRVVPMTARAARMVEATWGKLFVLTKWTYERDFQAAVLKAGIDPRGVVIHSLRHTCCTNLVTKGAGLLAAGAVLGHSTATMTNRYSHLDVGALRKTIGLLEE